MSSQLTEIKKIEGCEWLNDIPSTALQQAIIRLDSTLKRYIKDKNNKCSIKTGFPNFKKKRDKQSFNLTKTNFRIKNKKLYISNFKDGFKIKWSRELPSNPKSVTIIKDKCGIYYASFVINVDVNVLEVTNKIAIDLGIDTFVSTSSGEKYKMPELNRLIRKTKTQQKILARKKVNSKNFEKSRLKLAKTYSKICNIRQDFIYKLVRKLINENQVIITENLNIANMMKNSSYARNISLQGWKIFIDKLENECKAHNKTFHKVDRYFPSSQICSTCGYKWGRLDTNIRSKKCSNCGTLHDRDVNAAINILKEYSLK